MKNKIKIIFLSLSFFLGLSLLSGCDGKSSDVSQSEIAVTNSYLQCVVKDICGDQINVLCLTPPGMCPGHFDISPAQVNQLCNCRVLLLFDFQKKIEDSLLRIKGKGLKTGVVRAMPGLCVPETYLVVCKDVCNVLSAQYPDKKVVYNKRLKQIEKRLEKLSSELLTKTDQYGLKKARILTSNHQTEFAKWLGLDVVATFVGSDTETAANINQCLQKTKGSTVRFVIANKQEGTGLANAMAERLKAKVVVFSNFPNINNTQTGYEGFDGLLRENIQALLEAAK